VAGKIQAHVIVATGWAAGWRR